MAVILKLVELPAGLDSLAAEAATQGFAFLHGLIADWESGANRFDGAGEGLFGAFGGNELVAIAGLNCDPFLGDPTVGRIRRVYVRAAWRGRGIATQMVETLLAAARAQFSQVRLRAVSPGAARIYERLGFKPITDPHATHLLHLGTRPRTDVC